MDFEGSPEPIDFDFFDEGPSKESNGRSNSPDHSSKPVRPSSGKRSKSARGNDGDYDRESVRSVTSSRSSVSVRIPTATPTHDDGNDADYYSDDFDESDHKDRYNKEKDDETFRFKDDIGALKNKKTDVHSSSHSKSNKVNARETSSKTKSNSKSAMKSRPKSSAPRRQQRSRSNSSSSYSSETDSTVSGSSSFSSESSYRSSRSGRDNESVTSVSPLQSPASSPIPKLEYDEQEMERETEKMRSVRFVEDDEMDQRHSSGSTNARSSKGRPKSSKARSRPQSSPVKTPGYSHYGDKAPLRATEANELSVLLRAVLELDETPQSSELAALHEDLRKPLSGKRKNRPQSAPVSTMPHQRMNMSFSNDEVKRIDRENRRLLERIVGRSASGTRPRTAAERKPTSHSAVKRQREQRRIEIENMQILKRIEAARANPQIKKDSLLRDFHEQRKYANQVSKTPGGIRSRPASAKRAGKTYSEGGMAKASSMSSLGTDYTVDTMTSTSSRRSRPRSAKWSDSGSDYHGAKPAWNDRFYLDQ